MNKTVKPILLVLLIITAIVIFGKLLINSKSAKYKNAYNYDINELEKIPNEKLCKSTSSKIHVNLEHPIGISVDKDDNIFVCGNSMVLRLDKAGKEVFRFNTQQQTNCLTVATSDSILIGAKDHIEIYNSEGKLISEWQKQGTESYITSIAISDDFVYVADAGEAFVFQYNKAGKLLAKFGTKDTNELITRFILPSYYLDVAIDAEGYLWATNPGVHLLVNFQHNGAMRSYWGEASMRLEDFCGCCNPSHIAILPDGSFITSEKGIVRVKKYNPAGKFVCAIAGADSFEDGSTGLDIAVDSYQNIYVLEPDAAVIHKFEVN